MAVILLARELRRGVEPAQGALPGRRARRERAQRLGERSHDVV
jgi:hypothetical protein